MLELEKFAPGPRVFRVYNGPLVRSSQPRVVAFPAGVIAMQQPTWTMRDPDLTKGAVEGFLGDEDHGNANAPAIDDAGWPNDEVAIAQDVLGANEDQTQG